MVTDCFVKRERADFEKKGLDEDVINLRYKHYQGRLIDTINRVLEERRRIKAEQARMEMRQGGGATSPSPGGGSSPFLSP